MKLSYFVPTTIVVAASLMVISVIGCSTQSNSEAVAKDDDSQVETVPESLSDTKSATKQSHSGFSPYVDKDGKISLPVGYKQDWAHLGSWAVAKKKGDEIHEMHNVYTQPETVTAYHKTGEFPDGTVFVKEVHHTKADGLTTGHASWSTDIKIWFVMVKDRKARFGDNDHWGDGWGWALFEAKDPTKNVSAGYDTSCLACHRPVAENDWVYTYGYPDLKQPSQE